MLEGDSIRLRLVREEDLSDLHAFEEDIQNRGDYFPLGVSSSTRLRQRFAEDGLWSPTEGTLVIETRGGELLGHIEFFPTVAYLDEIELFWSLLRDDQTPAATSQVTGSAGPGTEPAGDRS